jgi:integrase
VRFHDLRHSAATLMIESGMDLATVADLLGHSTIATTVNVYGHLTARHKEEAMRRFSEAVG